jgi:hypothetical protein
MGRIKVLKPHGTMARYRQGCVDGPGKTSCDACKAANREYQEIYKLRLRPPRPNLVDRGNVRSISRPVSTKTSRERLNTEPAQQDICVGSVERAVRIQLQDFVAEHPTQVEMAVVAAKILDDPDRVVLHPTTIRQLNMIVEQLTAGKKKKSRGRLAAVQAMTDRVAR